MRPKRIRAIVYAAVVVTVVVVAAIYVIPLVQERSHNVALGREWAGLLKKHASFSAKPLGYPVEVNFSYGVSSDDNLRRLRNMYDLETIAGQGSETDRIINLTRWVFQLTGHANEPEIPKELNAFSLIRLAKDEGMQINCYMKTVILNEVFLAVGFSSRWTHLLPHSHEEDESHFVTSVYSPTLEKWILMDPDFGVYVTDEKANILGVAEIRGRLITGEPLVVKDLDPSQSILARSWVSVRNFIEGADYPWFLSEFIFKIRCPRASMFNQRSMPDKVYFELLPNGYHEELLQESQMTKRGKIVYMNDEGLFWQKPSGQSQ
jgi:hypothetical protein